MTKNDCRGCGDDYYNGTGAQECWMFKDAKIVTRYAIGLWTPMDTARNIREVRKPACYHERGNQRTVYMNAVPSHLRAEWNQLKREARESALLRNAEAGAPNQPESAGAQESSSSSEVGS